MKLPIEEYVIRVFWILLTVAALTFVFVHAAPAKALTEQEAKRLIYKEAKKQNVDPHLALAIAEVESNFNHKARGALGEIGLFQLRPEFHDVIEGDPHHNVVVALKYLRYVINRCAADYLSAALVCFNTGPNKRLKDPHNSPYFKKVKQAYLRMKKTRTLAYEF